MDLLYFYKDDYCYVVVANMNTYVSVLYTWGQPTVKDDSIDWFSMKAMFVIILLWLGQ